MEVPALAECLTLSKADFIRTGPRGATFLAYRKAVQEVVARRLAEWGDGRNAAEESRRRAARPVERDLEWVLADLADRYPLVAALVERREGGQRRLPMGAGSGASGGGMALTVADGAPAGSAAVALEPSETALAVEERPVQEAEDQPEVAPRQSQAPQHAVAPMPGEKARRRPGRYGLEIRFESHEGDSDFGRLIESTVWVNAAHPAYQRAAASRSEGYHVALSVAMALAPLAVEPSQERAFVAAFLERWGSALAKPKGRGRRRR